MKKGILLFFLLLNFYTNIHAQEFFCTVSVRSPQVEGTDKRVFESLQTSLNEFVNNRKWTNYPFQTEERIECSILITIDERLSVDEFKGRINLALRRPVYNTSYNTVLFNYVEESFQFKYIEFQSLDFNSNNYTSNLTSVIAYYLYFFLGLDFDSFSEYGGTPFFEKAQEIVNAAQSSPYTGWKSYESMKNKYWLVENMLNPSYRELRKFNYEYHRLGMDDLSKNTSASRGKMAQSLELLRKVYNEHPNLFALQLLVQSKRDEFIKLFSEGSNMEKNKVLGILKKIDPANSSKYEKIKK